MSVQIARHAVPSFLRSAFSRASGNARRIRLGLTFVLVSCVALSAAAQSQLQQTITFADPPSLNLIFWPVILSATSDSGLPVSFQVISGPAVVQSNVLVALAPGIVVVEADQPGDSVYLPAIPVQKTATFIQDVLLTTSVIHFGTTQVGQTSASAAVSILNFTTAAVSLGLIPSSSTDFALVGSNCGATLGADRACTLNIAFTPKSPGYKSTTVAITATGGYVLPLIMDGTGGGPVPVLLRNAITSAFNQQGIGQTSPGQVEEVSNATGSAVSLSGIGPVGDFGVINNTCGATLTNNSKCSFYVTFTPTALGLRTATMNIVAGGVPLPLALAGTGVPSIAEIYRSSITWGGQGLGQSSIYEYDEIGNFTGSTITLSGIANVGDFGLTYNTCGATLANNTKCYIHVAFTPTALRVRTATMNIVAGGTPLPLTLTGVGVPNIVSLYRNSITSAFNQQGVFQTSAGQYNAVSNFTASALPLSGIGPVGDFGVTNNTCGAILPSNTTCSFNVTFTPTALGSRTATMNIVAGSTSLPLALAGTGVLNVAVLLRSSITWGSQGLGQSTIPEYNEVGNFTGNTIALSGIANVGDFNLTDSTCGATLANNAKCYFHVAFTPTATGTRTATMNIVAGTTALPLALRGVGVPNGVSLMRNSITSAFNEQGVFQTSAGQYNEVSNFTGNAVSLSGLGPAGDFDVTNSNCGAILPNNTTCSFNVTFTPTALGLRTATMNIVAGGVSLPLALAGTGVSNVAVLLRSSIAWDSQTVGQPAPDPQYNEVGNFTGSTLALGGIANVGDFSLTENTCGPTLANNTKCYFYVNFTPTATGLRTATMNIDAGGTPLPLTLTGVGK